MKKQLFGGLCGAAMWLISCGPSVPGNEYRIEGTLTGVPDSTVISLLRDNGDLLEMMQCDTVAGGHFAFSDTLSATRKFYLLCIDPGFPSSYLTVWVAPGEKVEVTGNDKLINLWEVRSNLPEQVEQNRFADCTRNLLRQQVLCDLQRDSLVQMLKDAQQHGAMDVPAFQQLKSRIDSLMRLSFQLEYQKAQRTVECLQTAPFSQVWMDELEMQAMMLGNAPDYDFLHDFLTLEKPLKELYATLPDSVRQTTDGQRIYNLLYPIQTVGVGDEMVDGTLYDTEGQERHLAEFKGRYILLDFWSQGCGPCVQSIPELEKISDDYADRLTVVSISSDPKDLWLEFLKKKGLKGNQWNELRNDASGLAAAYNVHGIPHYVLIAPDGKVQDVWNGYGKGSLERTIKKHLP